MALKLGQTQHVACANPQENRKAIYTTYAIESLESVIRETFKKHKLFPQDDAANNVVYLAARDASKRWTVRAHNWHTASNYWIIVFEDQLSDPI